ncbi:stage V sporulation protein D (sporulation-specific penicillin-binding protein) [Geosporobacter subterraneus DSM 17957]|uniref:Stage V sporulation protein D (Sporulation-specific penicillin-binding protein) n=1 Tax=Geosporobacter subterraneus DSM 17957 TaxID=1121919 RepID=A0A1M6GWD0_9FIRM|nr:stage V sporulation protein D [Geosporobacter subterraneus]SHJ14249.1 stage V sporulation protein D (sporulation-specific penicillin-binding protein) [Geosporobacter subterraneus DSM 17957]
MSTPSIANKKRLVFLLFTVSFILFGLIFRIGWIQIVDGERYRQLAHMQQTRDIPIPAKRGIVFDRKGKKLAISASTSTVWARPAEVERSGKVDEISKELAAILEQDENDIKAKLTRRNVGLIKIEKWINKEKADAIRQAKMEGVWIAEDNRRHYPFGNFAAHILGHTTDDNRGLVGIELEYDKYLSGLPGRWIKNTDAVGRQLPYGVEKYYEPENGLNVVLTIDEVIQHFTEKALDNVLAQTKAKKVIAIVMDPKTGDILAMATKPDFDPNNPRVPVSEEKKREFESLDTKEKQKLWNEMWRNPMISDTYEPGSTFKLITSAAGLEEGVVEPNSPFYCSGHATVAGQKIRCWRYYNPHGAQTFTVGVQNSCNPVFIEIGQRLGVEKYYKYIEAFGFTKITGVDLPGEGNSIVQNKERVGPVELATISFGHGISVTPLQLVNSIAAIGNDGKLMKPRIVKELVDDAGNVIHRYEPKMVRQAVSEKTARELRLIMESVVTDGSGKSAYIPGYRIGGKTGTADKIENGRYASGKVYSSFVALAPIDDPRLAVLVVVDEPQGVRFGSLTAAPAVHDILKDSLRYMDIEPQYNEKEAKQFAKAEVTVPEVRNMTLTNAAKTLATHSLQYDTEPTTVDNPDTVIVDQFPKPGAKVPEKSIIILYLKKENP